jgi:hypothetical protein
LPNLINANCDLQIKSTFLLSDLTGLSSLRSASTLTIQVGPITSRNSSSSVQNNTYLGELGLGNLTTVANGLSIVDNPLLAHMVLPTLT